MGKSLISKMFLWKWWACSLHFFTATDTEQRVNPLFLTFVQENGSICVSSWLTPKPQSSPPSPPLPLSTSISAHFNLRATLNHEINENNLSKPGRWKLSEHKVPSVLGYESMFDLYIISKLTCKVNQSIHKRRPVNISFHQHFIINTSKHKEKLNII